MRRADAFLLFPPSCPGSAWQVGVSRAGGDVLHEVPRPPADDVGQQPLKATETSVAEAIHRLGYRGEPVVLAVPSRWCLAAALPASDLPRRRGAGRRQSLLLYRLEEHLPAAAESLAADFVDAEGGVDDAECDTLGVASDAQRLAAILIALGDAGVHVDRACPTALLAAQSVIAGRSDRAPQLIVWVDARGDADLTTYRSGKPAAWTLLRGRTPIDGDGRTPPAVLSTHLRRLVPPGGAAIDGLAVGMPPGSVPDGAAVQWTHAEIGTAEAAALRAAAAISTGRLEPWVDLMREAGATAGGLPRPDRWRPLRTPLVAASVAGLAMVACAAAAMAVRAAAYERLTTDMVTQQAGICLKAIGRPPPPGLTARQRLASEARRLTAASGLGFQAGTAGAEGSTVDVPILAALAGILAALPERGDPRYRLLEVQLAPDRLLLEGEARAHGDADALARGMRRSLSAWYAIDAPRTQVQTPTAADGAAGIGDGEVVGFAIAGEPLPAAPRGRANGIATPPLVPAQTGGGDR